MHEFKPGEMVHKDGSVVVACKCWFAAHLWLQSWDRRETHSVNRDNITWAVGLAKSFTAAVLFLGVMPPGPSSSFAELASRAKRILGDGFETWVQHAFLCHCPKMFEWHVAKAVVPA